MHVSGQTVCPDHFTAREKALDFMDLEAGWAWRWSGCFGEEIDLLLLLRSEHQIFQHIFESLY